MPNTYYQNYVHTTFPVKYRHATLKKHWRKSLFSLMGNLINKTGCKTLIVNGVEDHVHCLFGFKPSVSISDIMQSVKSKSSKWVNKSDFVHERFEWQSGFGCFTHGNQQIDKVYKYILNQEEHHKRMSFREEYLRFLKKYDIDYDERFIFSELI